MGMLGGLLARMVLSRAYAEIEKGGWSRHETNEE